MEHRSLHIERVKNGWIITPRPATELNRYVSNAEIFVFETFEAMTKWLQDNFTQELDD